MKIYQAMPSPDDAASIQEWLGDDLWNLDGSAFLILPSDRFIGEVIGRKGSGFVGRLLTVKGLALHLYIKLGGDKAVKDGHFRRAAVGRMMQDAEIEHLRPEGRDMDAISGHVSDAIGELLRNAVAPRDLEEVAASGRSRELLLLYRMYLSLHERAGTIDEESVPGEVMSLLSAAPSSLEEASMGIYFPGRMDRSYSNMLSRVLEASGRWIVQEHVSRPYPSFIGPVDVSIPIPEGTPRPHPTRPRVLLDREIASIKGDDRYDAARRTCRYIKELARDASLDLERVAWVTPGGAVHERYLPSVLEDYGIPVCSERDVPVRELPAVAGFMEMLTLEREGWRSPHLARAIAQLGGRLDPEGSGGVLGSELDEVFRKVPVYGGDKDAGTWIGPIHHYMGEGSGDGTTMSICSRAVPVLKWVLDGLDGLGRGKMDSRSISNRTRGFLRSLRDATKVDAAGEGAILRERGLDSLDRAISRLPSMDPDPGRPVSFAGAMEWLELILKDLSIGMGTSGRGVWLGKVRQQMGRCADLVVLHSMMEGEISPAKSDFNILAVSERAALGMREDPDRRSSLEDLAVCMSSGRELIVSYHLLEGESPAELSSFLEDIRLRPVREPDALMSVTEAMKAICERPVPVPGPSTDAMSVLGALPDREWAMERAMRIRAARSCAQGVYDGRIEAPHLLDLVRRRFPSDHIWSASRLESYRKCPYEFFVRYVLGIEPIEELEPEVPPDRKGIMVHSILEGFYRRWRAKGRRRVDMDGTEEAFGVMMTSARDVLSAYSYKGPFWDALTDLLLGQGDEKGLMREFIEAEAGYDGPFAVEAMEMKFGGRESPVRLDHMADHIFLEGFIDRLDSSMSNNGELLNVWDYKSGSRSSVDGRRSLQVPLYLAALSIVRAGSIPYGGGYYWVGSRGKVQRDMVIGSDRSGRDEAEVEGMVGKVRDRIDEAVGEAIELVRSIRDGMFSPAERCPNRSFCSYRDICRREE